VYAHLVLTKRLTFLAFFTFLVLDGSKKNGNRQKFNRQLRLSKNDLIADFDYSKKI
jgi:hypothetical protein